MLFQRLVKALFLTALALSCANLYSQPDGWWARHPAISDSLHWHSAWIWAGENDQNEVMLARRVFELSELPIDGILRITASSQYQLYVNGKYICRGPSRSAAHHQYYDILDVGKHLSPGTNCIAVRVHHQADKNAYQFKGRGGLLAQLDLRYHDRTTMIVSDKKWKVVLDPSWKNDAPFISRFNMSVNDRRDFRKNPTSWQSMDFQDSSWQNATVLMRNTGWPLPPKNANPQPLTPPWTALIPRDIPYLQEEVMGPVSLIEYGPISAKDILAPISLAELPAITYGGEKIKIHKTKPSTGHLIFFDFGRVRCGFPKIDIKGPAGTVVKIISAPYLVDQMFSHQVMDSKFIDEIILSGSIDSWEATYFKPIRYLGVFVQGDMGLVEVQNTSIRHLSFPFVRRGQMLSTDQEWVQRYMDATAETIIVCTTDGYTDNYRERRQYAQTGYYGALGNYWLFGDYTLQRRYLLQVAQEQLANGIMPAYAPLETNDFMVILDSNCLWLRSLRNYLLFSGDYETVRSLLPAAYSLLELLHSFTNDVGLIDNPPYPYWLDHSVIDRRGANFCLNAHYLGALDDFVEVLRWLGLEDQKGFSERASLIRQSLQKYFWVPSRGLFSDALVGSSQSQQFSEHSNALALANKVASTEQAESIIALMLEKDELNYIKRASGMTMVTPAMSYFLHDGICKYGKIDASFDLFRRRFDKMLAPEHNGTLWEEWWINGTGRSGRYVEKTRSDAQTESAFAPALFAEYLLGVSVLEPGWKKVKISPQTNDVLYISAEIPTPEGTLKVNWDKAMDGSGTLNIEIPSTMEVIVDPEAFESLSQNTVEVDGRSLKSKGAAPILLSEGRHRIEF